MSGRSEDERFDPERLRRLQWDAEGEDLPELGGAPQATEAPFDVERPTEQPATVDVEPQPVPEPVSEPEPGARAELEPEPVAPPQPQPEPEPARFENTAVFTEESSLDDATENVFEAWPVSEENALAVPPDEEDRAGQPVTQPVNELAAAPEPEPAAAVPAPEVPTVARPSEHAPGALAIPPGYAVLEGEPRGERRAVGIVVSRFNGDVTTRLLESALAELDARGVASDAITVMPVPGAFELPLAAMALAKTRRFACIVALGCVIRGDTPHFDYVASEAASGLQLAAIETGVPVAFGVLTLETAEQAEERYDKGAEAVVTALEMADVFSNLRTAAAR